MRQTLRRSCAACAKSKHSCDLATPRCSRCVTKKKLRCVYANEPLTAPLAATVKSFGQVHNKSRNICTGTSTLTGYRLASVDPFDSYPQTRLPRGLVHRLIHRFLFKVSLQFYPLDYNAATNPFLVTWWPLALSDPALFHVSLQTSCLDYELEDQKGFKTSELLMADSVALLRHKIQDVSLAVQDATLASIIILAAIEFGKGNVTVAGTHVNGVKIIVSMRGGINTVAQTSPLTAQMVCWVSMLLTGCPQFETEDDDGVGHGIPPTPQWQLVSSLLHDNDLSEHNNTHEVDSAVINVFVRDQSDVFTFIKTVQWLEALRGESVFLSHWDSVIRNPNQEAPCFNLFISSDNTTWRKICVKTISPATSNP